MKEVKIGKIKSLIPKKALKITLWILIAIIMLRGVISMIRPDKSAESYEKLKDEIRLSQSQINVQEEANSFAEGFVREFLEFKQGKGEEYRSRLSKYMCEQALTYVNASINSDLSVLDVNSIKSNVVSENKFDVDIRAKVLYATGVSKDIYLRVPVTTNNQEYVIEDLPLFIPEPSIASIKTEMISGNTAENNVTNEIKDMLNKFLRVYAEGQAGEITYYLVDSSNDLGSLNGVLKFKGISEVNAYVTEDANKYIAIANFSLEDQENKQEIKQKARLSVVYKDGKYYIESFDTRSIS
ncbi:conjugal transfer protein [Clostridium sulfidigenes]|uniref:conjugal transfer protein n=1 Tax=Clostridium sulfidigenes TaxID=318464 RepID=UPI003F8C2B05